jgi:hypothetical protein
MSTHAGPNIVEDGLVLSIDPANQKSYSPNLVSFPVYAASNWSNVFSSFATVTANIDSPDGLNNAVRFSLNNTGGALFRINFPSFTSNGTDQYTYSFYARLISGSGTASADLHDQGNFNYSSQLIVGKWVRITNTFVPTSGTRNFLDLFSNAQNNYVIDFWGAQVERSSSATPFNPNYYGQTIRNFSSNSGEGNLIGIPSFSFQNNGILIFDELDDAISHPSLNIPQINNISGSDSFTLSSWIKLNQFPQIASNENVFGVLQKGQYNPSFGINLQFSGNVNGFRTSAVFYYGLRNLSGTEGVTPGYGIFSPATSNISLNQWYKIDMVHSFSGTTHRLKFYINGLLNKDDVLTNPLFPINIQNSSTLTIGQNVLGGNPEKANVSLGPYMVYTRDLSDNEVKQNFNALRGRYGI